MTFEAAVGPDGSDTLFLRALRIPSSTPLSYEYAVIDLRNGLQLD